MLKYKSSEVGPR